jgi:aminomethyltransferase
LLEGTQAANPGDKLYADSKAIGVITCPMVSTLTGKSMAIARMDVPYAVHGAKITVEHESGSIAAIAHTLPFDDPEKKKRTVVG